ncbi:uncharacterized protein PHACADRAFT_189980 [Phanerochaete carnosa HHB-10118-sp]|uniref:DinB-like domain-containing protein n=1 Tax=Phanerochaete carnosa (strain HHB-10118-sp) TaxID=650164 RepID=K5WN55_PHACS|nr:uncharacterized protein PHACADRAFT_189980 [Phanerochaete carnosa HHB-10118-sp]EKM60855.1 hypothetical protein PHACADRAFT_189980 [Phanerochaete carnosa HHB-10118-sp]
MPIAVLAHLDSTGAACPVEDAPLQRLLEVSRVVLQQAVDLVDNDLMSDDQLTIHSQYMPGSTIGKHLRHARDHFWLLIDSMESQPPYTLNYDYRKVNMDQPVTLNAVTPYPQTMQSTFGRELWFGALHAVHHWSMVRVICGELGIRLDESFGFAPSTLVHQGAEAPLGRAKC